MLLCYIVGPPGVGKSTVMSLLTENCDRELKDKPFAHEELLREGVPVGVEIGRQRENFPGTDALSMSVEPIARGWIAGRPYNLIMGEGARLGTVSFLSAARTVGYQLLLIHLTADDDCLTERREYRGSQQDPNWIAGATTRARRLVQRMQLDADVITIDTSHQSLYDVVTEIMDLRFIVKEAFG